MNYKWNLYNYVDTNGNNVIKKWTEGLQTAQRAKLNQKLDMICRSGLDFAPNLISGTKKSGRVKKLKIKGNVQLRPMLCDGPINQNEVTLLLGAKEVGGKLVPANSYEKAASNLESIVSDPTNRRCKHERIR